MVSTPVTMPICGVTIKDIAQERLENTVAKPADSTPKTAVFLVFWLEVCCDFPSIPPRFLQSPFYVAFLI
jgi:hypothetical protein